MNLAPSSPDSPWTLRARWIFPVDAPPIPDGRITLRAGRIELLSNAGTADVDLGNVAILPGLVNAHTHLDLGTLAGQCPPTADLTAWLRCVIAGRRAASPGQVQEAIADGIAQSLSHGTTLVGDISAGGASWSRLSAAPLRSVVFHELLGLPRDRADRAWEAAEEWLRRAVPTERSRPGLSPHAPFSVHRDLLVRAARSGVPVTIHLAESQEELQVLRDHAGPFAEFLMQLGVWDPAGLVYGPEEVLNLLPAALLAHGNYLAADAPITPGHTVVYCPRTHAAFGHPPHPLPALMERGVRVALGTDSLASNPDLDMLAEARFLHVRHPGIAGELLLRLLTLNGAAALGWGDLTGSLTPGKYADLAVLELPDRESADPHALLWESLLPVQSVWVAGELVAGFR